MPSGFVAVLLRPTVAPVFFCRNCFTLCVRNFRNADVCYQRLIDFSSSYDLVRSLLNHLPTMPQVWSR